MTYHIQLKHHVCNVNSKHQVLKSVYCVSMYNYLQKQVFTETNIYKNKYLEKQCYKELTTK